MSFPSAQTYLNANPGAQPEAALLHAIQQDTPLGYNALVALSAAITRKTNNPLRLIRQRLNRFGATQGMPDLGRDALRCEVRGEGLKVDFDPDSKLGRQLSRIMGTDAARPLMAGHFGLHLGFANCCGGIASKRKADVLFTAADQVRWQLSIDC